MKPDLPSDLFIITNLKQDQGNPNCFEGQITLQGGHNFEINIEIKSQNESTINFGFFTDPVQNRVMPLVEMNAGEGLKSIVQRSLNEFIINLYREGKIDDFIREISGNSDWDDLIKPAMPKPSAGTLPSLSSLGEISIDSKGITSVNADKLIDSLVIDTIPPKEGEPVGMMTLITSKAGMMTHHIYHVLMVGQVILNGNFIAGDAVKDRILHATINKIEGNSMLLSVYNSKNVLKIQASSLLFFEQDPHSDRREY